MLFFDDMKGAAKIAERLFKKADIEINGSRPWDIQVHNEKLYQRVLAGGSLAFGEAYMDGWWDAKQLDQLLSKILRARLEEDLRPSLNLLALLTIARITNRQK